MTAIPSAVPDALYKVVYLIDTINGKEQILQNYNAISYYSGWDTQVSDEPLYWEADRRVVIITYAKFAVLLEKDPDFHKHFDYIICDELHSLIKFTHFAKQPNLHTIALRGLERAVKNDRTTVVALTATPERVKKEFDAPQTIIPIDDNEVIHYETKDIINYTNLEYIISTFEPSETGICYVSHIKQMKKYEQIARDNGLNPVCVWSVNNKDHIMTEEQLSVRQSLLKDFAIPSQYNFLIINASSETSLKIKTPVDYAIVHSFEYDTQVQVRGRVNNDLPRLYLPSSDPSALNPPTDFLDKPLFVEEKAALCDFFNISNRYNRKFRWPTIHKMLVESGYLVTEGRKNNKRYSIITSPDDSQNCL